MYKIKHINLYIIFLINPIMTLWPSWLRRRPAKPLGSARTGSNPVGVVFNRYQFFVSKMISSHNIYITKQKQYFKYLIYS